MGVTRPGIHKQLGRWACSSAGGADDLAVKLAVHGPAKRAPANFEGRKTALAVGRDHIVHALGLLHQQRAIGLHLAAVAAAKQAPNRHAGGFAQNIP